MLLIESIPNEPDDEFRTAVDGMLACVFDPSETQWWAPYDLGRTFEFGSLRFREFVCPAGSVATHLIMAAERQQFPRALITVGKNSRGVSSGKIIIQSETQSLDPTELQAV